MSLVRRKRTRPRWEQSTFKAGPDAETTATTYLHVGNEGANHGHELFRSAHASSSNHADGDEAAVPPMPSTLRRLQTAFEYLYHPHPRQPRYGLTSPTPGTAYADNAVIGIRSSDHVKQGRGERNGPSKEDGEQLRADGADGQEEGAGETQAQAKGDINTLLTSSLEQLQADLWSGGRGDTDSDVPKFVNPAPTSDNVTDTSEALTNSTSNGDEVEPLVSEGESNATDPDPSLPPLSSTETLLTFDIETPHNVSNETEAESTAATDVDNDPSFIDSAPESTSNSSALLEAAVEEETSVVESSDLLRNGCDATPMTCPDGSLNYKRGIPPDCVYPPCYAPGVHDADANGPLQQPPQDGAEPTVGSDGKPLWCPRITQLCDDGVTYVGLDPDTDCEEFEPCPPTTSPASSSSAGPTTNGDEPTSASPAPQTSSPTTLEPTMLLPTTSPTLPSPSPTNSPTFAPTQNEENGQNGPEFVSSQPDDEEEDTTTNPGPDQQPPAPTEPTPSPSPLPTRERNSDDRHNRDWKDLNIDAIDDPSSTVQLAPPKPEETTAPSEMSSSSPSQSATTSSPSPEPSAATTIPTATPSIVTMEPTPAQISMAPSASSSSPSATPTYENTISWEPTAEPTQEPTRSKAELVGFRPPTVGPQTEGPTFTLAPTTSPVPTTTIHPTATPAPTTLLDCLGTNSAYEYGKTKVWGDDMIATPVVYHYEVELIEEPRPGVVQNEVVPAIELAINQALLPSLFQCQGRDSGTVEDSGSADSLSIRARQVDGSPIAGITANPDDIVDQDSECNQFHYY